MISKFRGALPLVLMPSARHGSPVETLANGLHVDMESMPGHFGAGANLPFRW